MVLKTSGPVPQNMKGSFGSNVKSKGYCAKVKKPWATFKSLLPATYFIGSTPAIHHQQQFAVLPYLIVDPFMPPAYVPDPLALLG